MQTVIDVEKMQHIDNDRTVLQSLKFASRGSEEEERSASVSTFAASMKSQFPTYSPLPQITAILDKLRGAKTALDLKNGY